MNQWDLINQAPQLPCRFEHTQMRLIFASGLNESTLEPHSSGAQVEKTNVTGKLYECWHETKWKWMFTAQHIHDNLYKHARTHMYTDGQASG